MQATATDILNLPQLPPKARGCYKFNHISLPLISVLKLCGAGCNVDFHQNVVTIIDKQGTTLITGKRDPIHNLYMIKVPSRTLTDPVSPNQPTAVGAYTLRSTNDLIQYLHAIANSPPLVTFTNALQLGVYHTWPGLTVKCVNTLLSPSPYTAMGHLQMIKQGIQSTVTHNHTRTKCHKIEVMTFKNTELKHTISVNLLGHYPVTSARDHKYIFLMVDYDSNYIHAVPTKSCRADALVTEFNECYNVFRNNGFEADMV